MRWVTPFAYVDEHEILHLSAPHLLRALDRPETEANLQIALTAIAKGIQDLGFQGRTRVSLRANDESSGVSLEDFLRRQ